MEVQKAKVFLVAQRDYGYLRNAGSLLGHTLALFGPIGVFIDESTWRRKRETSSQVPAAKDPYWARGAIVEGSREQGICN
jgi:hypothetical protein